MCFLSLAIFILPLIFFAHLIKKAIRHHCQNACPGQLSPMHPTNTPATDIIETKENYVVIIDMPGFQKEDIEISLKRNQFNIQNLFIKGERKLDKFVDEKVILHQRKTIFTNVIYFNVSVLEKDIKATYDSGVLRIVIEKDAGNKIKIE
jgi:HSP20 family protein